MVRTSALAFLAAASPAMLAAFVVGGPAAEVLFSLAAAAWPLALVVLAVAPGRGRRGLGALGWALAALAVLLVAAVAGMLALRGRLDGAPWLLGLPLATAIQVYGVFLVPLPLVTLAYACTFDRFGLRRDDLDALRRRFGGAGES